MDALVQKGRIEMRRLFRKWLPLSVKVFLSHIYSKYIKPLPAYCRITEESGLNKAKRDIEIVVSLTTYPARVSTVHTTIITLLNQRVKPDKIVLWIGRDKFPHGEASLPKKLLALQDIGLTIAWTNDIRSYTKLIPALQEYPNAIIVTSDDDILYPKYWLEMLVDSYNLYPDYIHCHRALTVKFDSNGNVLPFLKWQWESTNCDPSFLNFLTGVGGVLYPPHCLDPEVFNEQVFMELAKTCDDHWFWAMAVLNGTKIKIVENGIRHCIVNPKASTRFSLCKINTGEDMKSNDDLVFAALCERYGLLPIIANAS